MPDHRSPALSLLRAAASSRPGARARRVLAVAVAAGAVVAGLPASASALPDVTPPEIRFQVAPSPGTGAWTGWYQGPTDFTATATDERGSGFARISYRLSGAQTGERSSTNPSVGTAVSAEGVTTVTVTASDGAGNVRTLTYGIGVDRTDPTAGFGGIAHGSWLAQGVKRTAVLSCADAGGAIVSCTATNDGVPFTSGSDVATGQIGQHLLSITAVDRVGRTTTTTIGYRVATPLVPLTPPSIAGAPTTATAGTTLEAAGGTFQPRAQNWQYRWYLDGKEVAVGPTYAVKAADIGKTVSMDMVATHLDHLTFITQRVGAVRVVASPLSVVAAPTVTGTPQAGRTLTATNGSVNPTTAPADVRWIIDGDVIETGGTLALLAEHAGKRLACDQTFTRADYVPVTVSCVFPGGATSIAVAPAPPGTPGTPGTSTWNVMKAPLVKGKAKVGKKLRAVLPRLSKPASSHRYQWLRNGKVLKGATKATYKIRKADRGTRLSVRVVSTARNLPTLVSVSAAKRVRR